MPARPSCAVCTTHASSDGVRSRTLMSNMPEVVPLFATPLVVFDVPDAATLNVELRRVIVEREKSHPTTQKSNIGGWQSSWDMDRWGGPAAIKLLAYARNLANRMTTDSQGVAGKGPYPG